MKQISPFSVTAPGYWGLNTQASPSDMDPRFALEATNCVIDKSGRVASRKGWTPHHSAAAALNDQDVTAIGEAISAAGVKTTVCAGNLKLFKVTSGTPNTLTELTYGGGGVAPTISANNWQVVRANGAALFWQRGHDPLVFDPALSATTYRRISEHPSYAGSAPQANCALSAFGRVWVADTATDKNTVTFTDTLTYMVFTGGTSGSLNLYGVWPDGGDEIVALAQHNNFLVILGKRQVLIYANPEDPTNLKLVDTISSGGCVGRDTVVNTPNDLMFLGNDGVTSLKRTIQEKSAPIGNASANVNDDIKQYLMNETSGETIKAGYSPIDDYYLLTFTSNDTTFCFDTLMSLQDGASRVTLWRGGFKARSYFYDDAQDSLLVGFAGYIGLHSGYYDNTTAYRMTYSSPWIDFGNPIQISILKKIIPTLIGALGQQLNTQWAFNYSTVKKVQSIVIPTTSGASDYGIAEYGIAEYGGNNLVVRTVPVNASGSGKVIQTGVELRIQGSPVSVQRIDIFTKDGGYKV